MNPIEVGRERSTYSSVDLAMSPSTLACFMNAEPNRDLMNGPGRGHQRAALGESQERGDASIPCRRIQVECAQLLDSEKVRQSLRRNPRGPHSGLLKPFGRWIGGGIDSEFDEHDGRPGARLNLRV